MFSLSISAPISFTMRTAAAGSRKLIVPTWTAEAPTRM